MGFSKKFADEVKLRFGDNEVLLLALEKGTRRQVEVLLELEAEVKISDLMEMLWNSDYDGLKTSITHKYWAVDILKRFLKEEKPFGRSIRVKDKGRELDENTSPTRPRITEEVL